MKQSRLINQVVGGSYEADERIAGCAVSQNLYAESVESAANGFYYTTALRSVPGERVVIDSFGLDAYSQGCRGLFVASDESVFAAFGDGIYRITYNSAMSVWSAERIFTNTPYTVGRVRFCETGGVNSHVCWVDGVNSTVFAYPLAPEKAESQGFSLPFRFPTPERQYKTADQIINETEQHVKPDQICAVNGCLVIDDPETDTWYFTDPYILGGDTYKREIYDLGTDGKVQYKDGSTYEVKTKEVYLWETDSGNQTSYLWLDRYSKPKFTTSSYSADRVTAIVSGGDFMYVFGTNSLQVYNQVLSTDAQGFSSMVFSSTGRNFKDLGCRVADTVVDLNQSVVFLGSSARGERSVWYTNGGTPMRISTNAIERALDGVDLSDAYALGYVDNGHSFYCLTVPAVNKTYVYDFATSQWHNRSTRTPQCTDGKWWAHYAVSSNGKILIAGKTVNKLVTLDRTKFDDYKGDPIIKVRTVPVITSDYAPFMVNDIMLLWNTGTTKDVNNSQGARDPVVMLEVSRDGGNTFEAERWAFGGRAGQYGHRSVWYGIGVGTYFVFRFTISDRVNVVITGAKISHTAMSRF